MVRNLITLAPRILLLGCFGVAALSAFAASAAAQVQSDLVLTAAELTVTATFSRNTPCTPYTIDWGDGRETVESGDPDALCIQVIDTVAAEHTYADAGTYDVAVTVGDDTVTETVTVSREVPQFDLDDVASITSEYVDPEPQMADEEYYMHTLTLDDGTAVTVRVAAFTTPERRAEAFAAAGYTGDIEKLLAGTDVSSEADQVPPPSPPADPERHLRLQLIEVLEELVQRLQQLLAR
jgi:PKD repeat protein